MALQVLFNGLAYGAALALIAIGLTLVFGILRIVNFAHGAMFMLGAYVTYFLTQRVGVNYFVAIAGAGLAVTVFRRFRGLLLEGAIAAIALALLIQNGSFALFSATPRQVQGGFTGVIDFGGAHLISHRLFIIVVTVALVVALQLFVARSRYGRALRALQQDPYVARLQGIPVQRMTVLALALGGALAGIAGALIAPQQVLLPNMGDTPLLLAFVVIILGGMGSVSGALVAAVAVGLVQSTVSTYWVPQAATWMSFALALVVLTVRPRGLFGHE